MPAHNRRLKIITFTLDGVSYECQLSSWTLDPAIEEGEQRFTFCPDGAFVEEGDSQATLALTFYSDWRSDGISDYLWQNKGRTVDFVLDHHPDIPAEHVRWSGKVLIQPGPVGGEARALETTEVTLQLAGEPIYQRV